MKKAITILLAGITLVSCGDAVPVEVQNAFKAKFPKAESVVWEMENDKEWEADFKLDGVEYSANFALDGTWTETEEEIKMDALPEPVKKTLKTDFSEYKLIEADIIESPKFSGFEVEIKKGETALEIVFSADGIVLDKKNENDPN